MLGGVRGLKRRLVRSGVDLDFRDVPRERQLRPSRFSAAPRRLLRSGVQAKLRIQIAFVDETAAEQTNDRRGQFLRFRAVACVPPIFATLIENTLQNIQVLWLEDAGGRCSP